MDTLPLEQLVAIGDLWHRSKRQITTAFDGRSMLPAIAPGQPVTLVCDSDVREGDVILAVQDGVPTVHRVVMSTDRWILCRGDSNLIPDPPIGDRSLILGRVSAVDAGSPTPVPPHRPTILQGIVLRCCALLLLAWFSGGNRAIRLLIALRRRSAAVLVVARRALHA